MEAELDLHGEIADGVSLDKANTIFSPAGSRGTKGPLHKHVSPLITISVEDIAQKI